MKLTNNSTRVYVVDIGHGPTALFLHGNPDSSDLWLDIIDRLKQDYRCLAPDLPGFGRSQVPDEFTCTFEGYAGFVEAVINKLEVHGPITLIVHDFGAPFGIAWALSNPERVRRLVFINTVVSSDYRWHFWARVWRTPLLGELSMLLMNRWLFTRELKRSSPTLTSKYIDDVYDRITPQMRNMVLQLYRATNPAEFVTWEQLFLDLTGRVPTMVLWGERDPYIPARFADRFGAQRVKRFPQYGHWLPVEAPEVVANELHDFLV